MFESVNRHTDTMTTRQRLDDYTISSPCEPKGAKKFKQASEIFHFKLALY